MSVRPRRPRNKVSTQQQDESTKAHLSIAGSTAIVSEFFSYAVNSILFQRGLYPPEDFKMVKKYGLNMLVTSDDGLRAYIGGIIKQLESWLLQKKVSRLVLAILSAESRETLERWQFDIHLEPDTAEERDNTAGPSADAEASTKAKKPKVPKTEKDIQTEIQGIIRQITASVTFLPVLTEQCVFTILIYADRDTEVTSEWKDSDAHLIAGNAEQVKLRSFSTAVHKVEAMVAYRCETGFPRVFPALIAKFDFSFDDDQ